MATRDASHAGSWYESSAQVLRTQLSEWLQQANDAGDTRPSDATGACRAVIAPHAGYSYSGPCAAHAYRHLNPTAVKRVFLLGPSHHHFTRRCCLTECTQYDTPLGSITVDSGTVAELAATGKFDVMSRHVDEAEHSLEMHLPYIQHCMRSKPFTLVPIMVGALSPESEELYGQLLAKYMEHPENFFVVSSDFCHWGQRFSFTWSNPKLTAIHKSIESLDYMGMELIEAGDPAGFTAYLAQFGNTICGRHPIGVLLALLAARGSGTHVTKFVRYEQSSQCKKMTDSSVSYASAVVFARAGR